ncbi:unnamed protein product [Sympodiomycopsis kandeliae]
MLGLAWTIFSGVTAWIMAREGPLVTTQKQGTFRGLYNATSHTDVFYGIPYAEPPLGDQRFRKSVSPIEYLEPTVRDATTINKFCLQSSQPTFDEVTSEDCLYLQIHRPAGTQAGDDLPVMFWIHGGAWTMGSTATWGYPSHFVQHSAKIGQPIIHVAAEYRLGVFGFLGGSDMLDAALKGEAVLNAGFHDQRLAMKWVQENIQSFGGDARKVTIFGQSAGAHAVGVHLLANGGNNQGLFKGAIMQSGAPATAARYRATSPRLQAAYDQLLNMTSCADLSCLRRMPSKKLRNASATINWQTFPYGYPSWMPVIDDHFIPEQISQAGIADVPVVIGVTLDEGTIFAEWASNLTDTSDLLGGILISQGNETAELAPSMLKMFKDDIDGSPFRPELFGKSSDEKYFVPGSVFTHAAAIFADWTFNAPMQSFLNRLTSNRESSTRGYVFAQPAVENYHNGDAWKGIPHGSGIAYIHSYPGLPDSPPSPSSAEAQHCNFDQIQEVAHFMSSAWIRFAYDQLPNTQWPVYTPDDRNLMYIQGGNMTTISGGFRKEHVDFFLQNKDVYRI